MLNGIDDIYEGWRDFALEQKEKALDEIIQTENLKSDETKKFMDDAFAAGRINEKGMALDRILPPMSRFGGSRAKKKEIVLEKLRNFFMTFVDIG